MTHITLETLRQIEKDWKKKNRAFKRCKLLSKYTQRIVRPTHETSKNSKALARLRAEAIHPVHPRNGGR